MWHSCGRFTKEALFAKCQPIVHETFNALEAAAMEIAPFHVVTQKSRLCFQLRTRCAGVIPQVNSLRFTFLSRTVIEHPRIVKVESFAPDQHVHTVRLTSPCDVDHQIREWLSVSIEYGEQRNRRK